MTAEHLSQGLLSGGKITKSLPRVIKLLKEFELKQPSLEVRNVIEQIEYLFKLEKQLEKGSFESIDKLAKKKFQRYFKVRFKKNTTPAC